MKQILVLFEFENVSAAQYDAVWADLRATGYANPAGAVFHVSAVKPNGGFRVVDVWESAEKFEAFGAVLMPLLAKHNIPTTQPDIKPVYWLKEQVAQMA